MNIQPRVVSHETLPAERLTAAYLEELYGPTEWERETEGPIDLAKTPSLSDSFTVLTTLFNSTPNLETTADCSWTYSLYCCGKSLGEPRSFTLTQPCRVDCTG